MRDKIGMNLSLTIEHDGHLPVPYFRPDDGESHPYVDLSENPDFIERIPEAREYPSLQNFLRVANDPASAFRTMGCITIPNERNDPRGKFEMRSYIDVGYKIWQWCADPENSFVLFWHFDRFLLGYPDKERLALTNKVNLVCNLKFGYLREQRDVEFWGMEWWTFSYADSLQEAVDAWSLSFDIFSEFLLFYSPEVERQQDERRTLYRFQQEMGLVPKQ